MSMVFNTIWYNLFIKEEKGIFDTEIITFSDYEKSKGLYSESNKQGDSYE